MPHPTIIVIGRTIQEAQAYGDLHLKSPFAALAEHQHAKVKNYTVENFMVTPTLADVPPAMITTLAAAMRDYKMEMEYA